MDNVEANMFIMHKEILTTIADMVRLHQSPPVHHSMFGGMGSGSGPHWEIDPEGDDEYTTYLPDGNGSYIRMPPERYNSQLYPEAFKPKRTNPLPKPQYTPADPTQVQKQDKKVKAKSEKKRIKKRRQKERKRLEKLKREQQKPKKNTEENGETKKADKATKAPVSGDQSSSGDSDSSDCSDDSEEEEEEEEEESSESETEELDLSSSFVNKAALILKRKLEQKEPKYKPERKEEKKAPVKPGAEPTKDRPVRAVPDATKAVLNKDISAAPINNNPTYEDNVKISTELAMLGNQHASAGRYDMAVQYFTAAIKYNPKEFKLFGNRSFCFEKLQEYEKALTDAQLSINMSPGWDKGLYRMGRALVGLKRYEEAASTYKEVLKLDSSCTEAAQELMRVQIAQLMEAGFTREQSSNALIIHGTMSKAMEVLSKLNPSNTGTIYKAPVLPPAVSEAPPRAASAPPRAAVFSPGPPNTLPSAFPTEHQQSPVRKPFTQNTPHVGPKAAHNPPPPVKTGQEAPKPPAGELFPIWVGNLLPTATVSSLSDLFSGVGKVHSIKLLSGKRCAFVNFTTQEPCDRAIRQYHGYDLMGSRLCLRYPDRIPPGMGISRAALKAEPLQEELYWQRRERRAAAGGSEPPHLPPPRS
ncbi:unnamed protein product [Gadus morhua 'NCC']